MLRLKLQVIELNEQLLHAEERRGRAQDMMEPMEVVKKRLEVSLEKTQEEVQVKTTQLKQYKKQADALREKVDILTDCSVNQCLQLCHWGDCIPLLLMSMVPLTGCYTCRPEYECIQGDVKSARRA